jgi:glycosyltransferase involved in cell wall biosynthesis
MTAVRLYGHQLGYTSFSQVTRGFARALGATGLFGGFVPLDFYDEDVAYPGTSCPIAVNTGMPSGIGQAKLLGAHRERYLMLAPNSDRVPDKMLEWLPELATGLLSPSVWGCDVLRSLFDLPVHYVPHGVHEEYQRQPELRDARLVEFSEDRFRVLHMTSTNSERKGTKLLMEAWGALEWKGATLRLVCRFEGYAELEDLATELGLGGEAFELIASDGAAYDAVNRMYGDAHVLCQPSRAEGFGLCPLEAKAAGVPVVMTNCTGHRDHARLGAHVLIETGPDEPIDDLEGAKAPSLHLDAIVEALRRARTDYLSLEGVAALASPAVREQHSWANTTGKAMEALAK